MTHSFITHIIFDGLPEPGKRKQVTPICSSAENIEEGIYFLGYNGCRKLKRADLEEDSSIRSLATTIPVQENCTVWIDDNKEIFYRYDSDEILLGDSWEQTGTTIV